MLQPQDEVDTGFGADMMDFFHAVVSPGDAMPSMDTDDQSVGPNTRSSIPRSASGPGEAGKAGGMVGAAGAARRRKRTKLSTEEEAADAEMKKLKSVQSARDCRRRKKAFIQSLQVRVKECEDREAQTQARIASLERELKQLQAARGEIHPATQAEATIIETLLAVDSTLDDEMLG